MASFLLSVTWYKKEDDLDWFSSLSESGFIPTMIGIESQFQCRSVFSSLSESGFIPTRIADCIDEEGVIELVLISFREWLHSYMGLN